MHSAQPLATHPAPAARRLSCTYSQPCTLSVASRALAVPRGLRRPNLALDRCKISTSQPASRYAALVAPWAQHQTQDDQFTPHYSAWLHQGRWLGIRWVYCLGHPSCPSCPSHHSRASSHSSLRARVSHAAWPSVVEGAVSRAKLLHQRPLTSRAA
jgi:hypothetical protein